MVIFRDFPEKKWCILWGYVTYRDHLNFLDPPVTIRVKWGPYKSMA